MIKSDLDRSSGAEFAAAGAGSTWYCARNKDRLHYLFEGRDGGWVGCGAASRTDNEL
ncbi:hypothetical protein SAMN04490220_4158 [Rhodococcus jostii]|uniref:Uncharacterized protein n=1 Tax=Rhodococcus jostii TaxID=132919 RepID=A0A1H4ZND2_RHOJO|nr:hypothetical protein SAMN04490220_4158 [Rhodococcus jostii]